MSVLSQLAETFLSTPACTLQALPRKDVNVLVEVLMQLQVEYGFADVTFTCTVDEPYSSIEELIADVEATGNLKVKYREGTLVPANVYTFFRGVHDLVHHYRLRFSFAPCDEFRAGTHLASLLWAKSPLAASYAFADVAGFNSIYAHDKELWAKLHPKKDVRLLNPFTWQPLEH